jgi:type II secretory pathway pseudopilin PulG
MSRGIVLIEVTIGYVLLTLALVVLLPVFILAVKAGKNTQQLQAATYLSQELMEEVRMRKWDQNSSATPGYVSNPTASPLGPEAGETDKTKFNDIGDFNGWTESPAADPLNHPLPAFASFSRSVAVAYVDPATLVVLSTPTTSDFKQVTVCTQAAKLSPICLKTVFANR